MMKKNMDLFEKSIRTVSYTHLDVYKRQHMEDMNFLVNKENTFFF